MSEPYEILDHTADIGFRAWGATVAELFENSARAMMSIAADPSAFALGRAESIELSGEDYESLLVDWLNEILFLFDSNTLAPKEFRVEEITPTTLRGHALGEKRDPQRHPWTLIIKAVTYYEIRVEQRDNRWEAQVFLDI
jgi:SHS2 domain-containing protein